MPLILKNNLTKIIFSICQTNVAIKNCYQINMLIFILLVFSIANHIP